MAFVITQRCCNDASCVDVCPVDCIRPSPEDPNFGNTEMLYIDPGACIDCGACVPACPVSAIRYEDDLPGPMERYRDINATYFERHPLRADPTLFHEACAPPSASGARVRVAIVGAGAAACYAAEELQARLDVEVEIFDRLPTPYGLVRLGVAPDHAQTKQIGAMFGAQVGTDAVNLHLNVEVGRHISHEELMRHHHAVLYAVGAFEERRLGVSGEDLTGSHPASEFVAWYNGHPDYADMSFDLSGERAVVIGNGNVALDIARVLLLDNDELKKTDIADHALDALQRSNIREVLLLGRRGPVQAAYSSSEFLAFGYLPGVDVVIDRSELNLEPASRAALEDPEADPSLLLKMTLAEEFANRSLVRGNKRVVFRYRVSPTEILGDDRVIGIRLTTNELVEVDGALVAQPTGDCEEIDASLILRSVGFRGRPIADLPFDQSRATVPNRCGRVIADDGEPLVGVYVAGWIKRGATGTIGTNKHCARETVDSLIDDLTRGRLEEPEGDRRSLNALLDERQPDRISAAGWRAIDQAERRRGWAVGRPRVKFTDAAEIADIARGTMNSNRK